MVGFMTSAAMARPASCVLQVDAQTFIDGSYGFRAFDDGTGNFQILNAGLIHFAYLYVEGADVAPARWNAGAGRAHAHTPLGTISHNGACWVGATTRICATAVP